MSWMHHPFVETFLQHQYRLKDLFFLLCLEAMEKILYAKGNSAMALPTRKCMRQDVSKLLELSNDELYLMRLKKKIQNSHQPSYSYDNTQWRKTTRYIIFIKKICLFRLF